MGCCEGEFVFAMAAAHPERNFVGVDIRARVVERAALWARERRLPNVCFLQANVQPGALERLLEG